MRMPAMRLGVVASACACWGVLAGCRHRQADAFAPKMRDFSGFGVFQYRHNLLDGGATAIRGEVESGEIMQQGDGGYIVKVAAWRASTEGKAAEVRRWPERGLTAGEVSRMRVIFGKVTLERMPMARTGMWLRTPQYEVQWDGEKYASLYDDTGSTPLHSWFIGYESAKAIGDFLKTLAMP